jgi:integrase
MTNIHIDYVQAFIDRHGKVRHYFRRNGYPRVPLPGLVGSVEFMAAYSAALAGAPLPAQPKQPIGQSKTLPGSVNAAVVAFYQSPAFLTLKPVTKAKYRLMLELLRERNGDRPISGMASKNVMNLLATKSGKSGAQRNMRSIVKTLLTFAIDAGMYSGPNPAVGIKLPTAKGDGFHSWTEAEIARFESHHPIGTRPRLALALLLYTAQRRADVVQMGRQHVRDGELYVTQSKTGTSLTIEVLPALAAIIAATPSGQLTFLVNEYGRPFASAAAFGNWFRVQCRRAGLPLECAAHGLRKAACRRLAEAGMSANVIASISGHKSLKEVERYTRAADQRRMAKLGMAAIGGTDRERIAVKPADLSTVKPSK